MSEAATTTRDARRNEIIAAAWRMAAEEGWPAVTLRGLAKRLGCSAPAIYQYFRDKEAIQTVLAAESAGLCAAALATTAATIDGPAKRIRALGRAYVAFGLANPGLYGMQQGLDEPVRAILIEAFRDLVERKGSKGTPDDLADRLGAVLHGFVTLALSARFEGGERRAVALAGCAVDDMLKGIARR
ncbi:MAG: TetR/AcrR family transcriptional regulator [Alphaproteobacteria bacterium]|nr:TetR/AcrR family transcriptional regulator [Alphaproteobacteria bacterium]